MLVVVASKILLLSLHSLSINFTIIIYLSFIGKVHERNINNWDGKFIHYVNTIIYLCTRVNPGKLNNFKASFLRYNMRN